MPIILSAMLGLPVALPSCYMSQRSTIVSLGCDTSCPSCLLGVGLVLNHLYIGLAFPCHYWRGTFRPGGCILGRFSKSWRADVAAWPNPLSSQYLHMPRRHVFVLFGILRWLGVSCIHSTPRSNYDGQYEQGTPVSLGHLRICWQDALVGQPVVGEYLMGMVNNHLFQHNIFLVVVLPSV